MAIKEGEEDSMGHEVDAILEGAAVPSSLRQGRAKPREYNNRKEYGVYLNVRQALAKLGDSALEAIDKEKKPMQRRALVPPSIFVI